MCTTKNRPEAASHQIGNYEVSGYAACAFWRRQASSPPSAIIKPGKPAPTMGPGTAAVLTTIFTSATGVRLSPEKSAKSNLYVPTKLGSNPPMAADNNKKPRFSLF